MKPPKGPELKMPDVKAPAFIADLYYDLRDRRLLPLVALVLVAIVATPFLLGQGSEPAEPLATPQAIQELKEAGDGTQAASLTVVEAKPGLRDYRKRLRRRTPLDPFRSRAKPSLKGARLGKGAGGESPQKSSSFTSTSTTVKKTESSQTTTTTTEGVDGGSGGGDGGSAGGPSGGGGAAPAPTSPGGKPHGILYNFAVNLRIVHVSGSGGGKQKSEPDVRKKVLPATVLPSKEAQVVTYMGLSPDTRKPLFLVSTDVTGVFGEGHCVAGTTSCQLIELEPGFPETFEYGEDGDRYKFKVTDVKLVVTGQF